MQELNFIHHDLKLIEKIKKIAEDINKVVQGNNFTQFVIYLIIGLQYIE